MNSKEEVLQLIKEGNITVEEGVALLKIMEGKNEINHIQPIKKKPSNERILRIDVNSEDGDRVKVNVPLSFAKLGLKFGENLNINGTTLSLKGLDIEEILNQFDEDSQGEIISVDDEKGSKVRIFID